MSLESFKQFVEFISSFSPRFEDDREEIVLICSKEEADQLTPKLLSLFPTLDVDTPMGEMRFGINYFDFNFFWSFLHFREKLNLRDKSEGFRRDIAIYGYNGSTAYYKCESGETLIDFIIDGRNYLFKNAEGYCKFLGFLKKNEHKEDSSFHLVDYFSWDNRLIVFTSAKKEGRLLINFLSALPDFDASESLGLRFDRFHDAFDKQDKKKYLPKFIKVEFFNFLASIEKDKRMLTLIEKLNPIMELAEQNFDVFLSDLSFENLRKEYLEQKEKFFSSLRDITGKITTQIIGVPISVSAVALATYNIKEYAKADGSVNTSQMFYILIGAFSVYSIFAVVMLRFYKEDIDDIDSQFTRDFNRLRENKFFENHKDELAPFETVKVQLRRKVNLMRIALWSYFTLFGFTNVILVYFLLTHVPLINILCLALIPIYLFFYLINFEWIKKRFSRPKK